MAHNSAGFGRTFPPNNEVVPDWICREQALQENIENDEKTGSLEREQADKGASSVEEVHNLSYPFAATHNLVPTCVEWNKDGFVLAVAYGRKDISGWCDLPGRSTGFRYLHLWSNLFHWLVTLWFLAMMLGVTEHEQHVYF